ncbi:hypothetical protein [Zhongshania sp. BJYM1]|uniref:hypothetical protein n=1 Tax=Zhongshania aquatica TaxID=2965069 RepID=UPI0022B5C357|nr:hypothetical protein [Marortus sp. BJYM1]
MSAKEFAAQLKTTIEGLRANGTAAIFCDNLIAYLEEVVNSPSPVVTQAELEHYKAQLQVWVEAEKRNHVSDLEMFRSVIQSGQNAIKTSFFLNGGASVALLAFIGKLTEEQHSRIPSFALALTIFVMGVFCIAMTSGLTYLSQWFYAESELWKQKVGLGLNVASILLGLASYGFFIWGMCRAYESFLAFV